MKPCKPSQKIGKQKTQKYATKNEPYLNKCEKSVVERNKEKNKREGK